VVVLTFYNGQRSLLAERLSAAGHPAVDVVSVDAMQGREADVVVLSCVRTSMARGGLGFLADWRRLNVALSRAREQMVVVGCRSCLQTDPNWRRALQGVPSFPNIYSFKAAYCDTMPTGWAASAGVPASVPRLSTTTSGDKDRQLDRPLDKEGACELAAIERLSSAASADKPRSPVPMAAELTTAAGKLSLAEGGGGPTGTADGAWEDGGGSSATAGLGAADLTTALAVVDSWDDIDTGGTDQDPTAEAAVVDDWAAQGPEGVENSSATAACVPEPPSSWSSGSEAGEDGEEAPVHRPPPVVRGLLSSLEAAAARGCSLAQALEEAAPGLRDSCPRQPQQVALLNGVAALLEGLGAAALPATVLRLLEATPLVRIAKALYDLDVVEEEAVVAWVDDMKCAARLSGGSYTARIKQMAPFVKWLSEADEGSSSDG